MSYFFVTVVFLCVMAVVLSFLFYKIHISDTDLFGSTFVVIYYYFIYFCVPVVFIHGIDAYSIDHIVNCSYFISY
jgi:hypothetical protein